MREFKSLASHILKSSSSQHPSTAGCVDVLSTHYSNKQFITHHIRDSGLHKAVVDGPPGIEVRGKVLVTGRGLHAAGAAVIPVLPWLHGPKEVDQLGISSISAKKKGFILFDELSKMLIFNFTTH